MAKKKSTPPKPKRDWRRAIVWGFRLILPAAAAAIVVYGGLRLTDQLIDSPHFQLKQVEYHGVRHLDQASLDLLIKKYVTRNLWMVDLDQVQEIVESEPWVESTVIRRQFPDKLQIFVRERTPVAVAAIGDELRVVDRYGRILDEFGPNYHYLDRPIVTGLKNTALENAREENEAKMRVYLQLLQELDSADPSYSKQLSEVDVSDVNRVAVVPSQPAIPVYLGSQGFAARYQTFLSQVQLLERLRKQHGAIESVDLTYENRIIVHTPQSPKSQETELSKNS